MLRRLSLLAITTIALSWAALSPASATASPAWWGWGLNDVGQLGLGTTSSATVPTAGDAPAFTSVVAGISHACGLSSGGAAYCWGTNTFGQLGTGDTTPSTTPRAVVGGHLFASVSAGSSHTCGLTAAGSLYCWGINNDGELGQGNTSNSTTPLQVAGTFSQVSAGGHNTCALSTGGAAYCWGDAFYGQIGNGTSSVTDVLIPTAVTMPGGVTFTSLSSGYLFECALATTGRAYCWGDNPYGQLGVGDTTDRSVPTEVSPTLTFASISSGSSHTCGISSGGDAYCWGLNSYGQLGLGDTTSRSTPTQLTGQNFTAIESYETHSCALGSGGQGSCWGRNSSGELGRGTTSARATTPGAVDGVQRFSSLLTGQQARDFTLAIPLREAAGDQVPTAAMQQFARGESDSCEQQPDDLVDFPALGDRVKDMAWSQSWAQWPNDGTGGFVCTRQPYYTTAGTWAVR